jgi:hypothetical protein
MNEVSAIVTPTVSAYHLTPVALQIPGPHPNRILQLFNPKRLSLLLQRYPPPSKLRPLPHQ